MAKKVFKADLSISSISELKNQLIAYKSDFLQVKLEELLQKISEKGVEIARANITQLDAIFTGELINSIQVKKGSTSFGSAIFFIVADSKHAAFVEFGTGQLGLEGGYPYPFPNGVQWEYNTGSTIFEIEPGQYGWFYNRDGQWYFTQGMPSRPFMHETSIELAMEVNKIAKEVFGRRV